MSQRRGLPLSHYFNLPNTKTTTSPATGGKRTTIKPIHQKKNKPRVAKTNHKFINSNSNKQQQYKLYPPSCVLNATCRTATPNDSDQVIRTKVVKVENHVTTIYKTFQIHFQHNGIVYTVRPFAVQLEDPLIALQEEEEATPPPKHTTTSILRRQYLSGAFDDTKAEEIDDSDIESGCESEEVEIEKPKPAIIIPDSDDEDEDEYSSGTIPMAQQPSSVDWNDLLDKVITEEDEKKERELFEAAGFGKDELDEIFTPPSQGAVNTMFTISNLNDK